ncbi:MAG: YafY family transcriptional regulator [Anaerolineae bacterium]|nr:YafY family transcriptional regulator [Anaerolineae bacterium]
MQSRTSVSGADLAQTLEVDVRSVRRYVTMLRDMGIPVESEKGRYGSYSLRPGFRMPPLMFTESEILSVFLGLMAVRRLGMATSGGSESATAKILRVLPEELRDRVRALQGVLTLDIPAYQSVPEHVLSRFSLSAYQHSRLWIEYWGGGRRSATERAIDVYGLVYHTGFWYAVAYCHLRADTRVFRLDRVRQVTVLDEAFAPPPDFDALKYLQDSIASIPSTWRVEVLFTATLEQAQNRIPPDVGTLVETPAGVLLHCFADGLEWMSYFLISTRLKFAVHQPPELRDKLREIARSIRRMAKEPRDA